MRTGVHCSDSAPTASPAQAITTPTAILYLYVNHILRISILITSPCLLYTGFNAPHAIIPHCSAKKQNKSLNKSLHVTGSAHKKHRLRSAASKTAKPEPVWLVFYKIDGPHRRRQRPYRTIKQDILIPRQAPLPHPATRLPRQRRLRRGYIPSGCG